MTGFSRFPWNPRGSFTTAGFVGRVAAAQAARALRLLKTCTPAWLRADDIAREMKRKK